MALVISVIAVNAERPEQSIFHRGDSGSWGGRRLVESFTGKRGKGLPEESFVSRAFSKVIYIPLFKSNLYPHMVKQD
ncbi:hypothetical protein [Streptomyces sp. NPDC005438]|uniref:hypothetical protein n=1 Tax=Streptomyces sp. NPDC005438 TaxID=3156880 RepID=UPI0033A8411A